MAEWLGGRASTAERLSGCGWVGGLEWLSGQHRICVGFRKSYKGDGDRLEVHSQGFQIQLHLSMPSNVRHAMSNCVDLDMTWRYIE